MKEHMPEKYAVIPESVKGLMQQPDGLSIPIAEVPRIPVSDRGLRRLAREQKRELMRIGFEELRLQFWDMIRQANEVAIGYRSFADIDWNPEVLSHEPILQRAKGETQTKLWHVRHEQSIRREIRREMKGK